MGQWRPSLGFSSLARYRSMPDRSHPPPPQCRCGPVDPLPWRLPTRQPLARLKVGFESICLFEPVCRALSHLGIYDSEPGQLPARLELPDALTFEPAFRLLSPVWIIHQSHFIVVWKLNRFSLSLEETIELRDKLRRVGTKLVSTTERGID